MTPINLSSLHLYPVKSCAGITVEQWEVDAFGLRYDRRWMVATPRGRLVSQRECPSLAVVQVEIAPPHLVISAPGRPKLVTPLKPMGGRPIVTQVWEDTVFAVAPDHKADQWFSDHVGGEVMLAYLADEAVREVDPEYSPSGGRTGFADGFPFLLIGETSLADLNGRLKIPVPMNRFRPNLVVSGSPAFAEDGWSSMRIGGIPMDVVKPCARCVVTTTDQTTGARTGYEPLRTLAGYRRQGDGAMFGQNVVHRGEGVLRVGDAVEVRG
jgi:hypothetical protein